jgi:uncharacterized protein (TIGR01319 family)
MPTPAAVKQALELLSKGDKEEPGFGELLAVDLGGATTDVYSVAQGLPQSPDVVLKGLVEPPSKRTVEGDIGMRYSAPGVLEAAGAERLAALAKIPPEEAAKRAAQLEADPGLLPETSEDAAFDFALAAAAVETAVGRHAGTIEEVYTPTGPVFVQTGKDLSGVSRIVLTGGAVIHSKRVAEIGSFALYQKAQPASLRPQKAEVYVDSSYILAAMGLLAETAPRCALRIMKKEILKYGT